MKKLTVLLLVLLMISQTVIGASYSAYPLGDGRVEIIGTKNPDKETTLLIKSADGTKIMDLGQVGAGEDEFSKILFIKTPDENAYNIEIGAEVISVKNISPEKALEELENASAEEFENVLMSYNKIFEADLSLMVPVCDKENAYIILADKDFASPATVASEYAAIVTDVINNEIQKALSLVKLGKSDEAISKYSGHFNIDMAAYSEIVNKTLVHICLDGNEYSDSEFEAAFADALILAKINQSSGEEFIENVRTYQSEIGIDLSESANIAPIVFNKVDGMIITSFAGFKKAFEEEIALNKLNVATQDTIKSVLEAENAILGILDTPGYSELSAEDQLNVCKAMARTDFNTIADARAEFALVIERVKAGTPSVPSTPSKNNGGGSYAVTGGGSSSNTPSQPETSPFTDISSSHWGYASVMSLYNQGIVSGTSETTFEPEREVTREEFVKMLVGTFGMYNANASNVFIDVEDSHWAAKYIASAYNKGLTQGREDGSFGLGDTLTRQDMAVLSARCAEIVSLPLSNLKSVNFNDESAFADYATESIYKLAGAGIINGVGNGAFAPDSSCTRAMAAKVCDELLKIYKGGAY